jgi:hypothetical protein
VPRLTPDDPIVVEDVAGSFATRVESPIRWQERLAWIVGPPPRRYRGRDGSFPTGPFTTTEEVATLVVVLASERTANVTGANYVHRPA